MREGWIVLSRDCEAIEIPAGTKTPLKAGSKVEIMQMLGGNYTVVTDHGYMVRIDGKDADAIGEQPVAQPQHSALAESADGAKVQDWVWAQLKTVYDPEIPVNVVDLGLVYKCEINPVSEGGNKVYVEMTLTAPGCGMGDFLKADAENKLKTLPGIKDVEVKMVVDPPWNPSMMTEAARLELGMM